MRFYKNRKLFFWMAICAWFSLAAGQTFSITPTSEYSSPLVINEFVAANGAGLTDEDGDYSDWIELYNQSSAALNLAGWALTDDPNDPEKWLLPDLRLESGAYLLIFASGKDRKAGPALHTNFKLDQAGEFLALYNQLDQRLVAVAADQFPAQLRDLAYSRRPDGAGYRYLARPTPGQANDETAGWQAMAAPVEFSVNRGFYDTPFLVDLTTATPGATIRYTLDGSEPAETNGFTYTGPIKITSTTPVRARSFKADYLPGYLDTQTYIFLEDVLAQNVPPGFPAHWGISQKDIWEYKQGAPAPADYGMDPEVVNDPRYRATIRDDLKTIPSLSIVTGVENYDIYAHPQERGRAWERPVSVELIDPETDQKEFQINAGLRLHGARGREEHILKHSFRLFFRGEYGAARLVYPLFDNAPIASFDTLVLRGGVNRSYAGQVASTKTGFEISTYTEDEWMRASQIEMSGIGSHGLFVHLYLNGVYWGLYNLAERPDAAFMAAYFGGAEEDWYVANASEPVAGPPEAFETLKNELYQINNLPYEARYPAIQQRIDISHFVDYIILNWYAGTKDWPHNNWYASVRLPHDPIRYFVWDGEVTWIDGANITLGGENNEVKQFFEALSQYPDFRMILADRLYKHLFNDGALSDANSQARWLRLNNLIDRAIVGESARWGDARYETPLTRDDWLKARDRVLAQMEGNSAKLIRLAREAGYYPDIDPPLFNQPGGLAPAHLPDQLKVTLFLPEGEASNPSGGAIYYTLDGSDPRLPGTGAIAPGAHIYNGPIVLTATTQIKARTLANLSAGAAEQTWSALNEATFTIVAAEQKLRLSQIMYNPIGGSDYEFIELRNLGAAGVDLSGSYFEGIDYSFPARAELGPGGCLALVRNPEAFSQRYPRVPVGGIYDGKLSNKGERISLKNAAGQIITLVAYDDENGWPLTPDGRGDALVMVDMDGAPDNPKSWQASPNLHGTPCK